MKATIVMRAGRDCLGALLALSSLILIDVDNAIAGLQKSAGFLRGPIGRTVGLQHAPELRFFADASVDMSEKLAQILRDDEERARAAGREVGQAEPAPVTPGEVLADIRPLKKTG